MTHTQRIDAMIAAGATIDEIDERVIRRAPLTRDGQSALWLYAWARQPPDVLREETDSLLALTGAGGQPERAGGDAPARPALYLVGAPRNEPRSA